MTVNDMQIAPGCLVEILHFHNSSPDDGVNVGDWEVFTDIELLERDTIPEPESDEDYAAFLAGWRVLLPPAASLSPAEAWELLKPLGKLVYSWRIAVENAVLIDRKNDGSIDVEGYTWTTRDPAVLRTAANRLEAIQQWLSQLTKVVTT